MLRRLSRVLVPAGCLAVVLLADCAPDQRAELERLKTDLNGAQSRVATIQSERDALRSERDTLRTKLDDLGKANEQVTAQNRDLQSQLKTAQDENDALRKDLSTARGTVKVLANLLLDARCAGRWVGEFVIQPTWAWIEKLAREYWDASAVAPTFQ